MENGAAWVRVGASLTDVTKVKLKTPDYVTFCGVML
jgi:hypothetical protein